MSAQLACESQKGPVVTDEPRPGLHTPFLANPEAGSGSSVEPPPPPSSNPQPGPPTPTPTPTPHAAPQPTPQSAPPEPQAAPREPQAAPPEPQGAPPEPQAAPQPTPQSAPPEPERPQPNRPQPAPPSDRPQPRPPAADRPQPGPVEPEYEASVAQRRSLSALDTALTAACGGDQTAFAEVYRDLHPRLLRYAAVLVGQDAEDVVSDSWLQIARDLERFTGDMLHFRAWTARIVRNRAVDHLRAQARRPQHAAGLNSVLDRPSQDDTAQSATDAISTGAALALIASLPRNQAEAVLLRAVVGLDPASAGKVLGKRPGAVRVAAHRGLRTLEQQLQRAAGGAS